MTIRSLFFLFLTMACSVACLANQQRPPASPPSHAPAPAPPPPPDKPVKQVGRARAYYDPRHDRIVALANGWAVGEVTGPGSPDSVELLVDFSVPGSAVAPPQGVWLSLHTYVKQRLFTTVDTLAVVVDGKTIFAGDARLVRSACSSAGCDEAIQSPLLPLSVLKQIVSAKQVVFSVGGKNFDLGKDAWEALRDIELLAAG